MRINSVSNVSFGAQTKKGNDYKKSHTGLAAALITGSLTGTSQIIAEIYKGNLSGKAIIKPAKIAAAAVAISAAFGAGIDYLFNIKNARKADENPMTLQQKFERDFNSPKFGVYYDANVDAVIVENKNDSDKYNVDYTTDRSKKDNQYTLRDDGSVTVTLGRDHEWENTSISHDKDGAITLNNAPDRAFIENNEEIKKIVNEIKAAKFYNALTDKSYKFSYDKSNKIVKLEKAPLSTPSGPYLFDSFRINSDGLVSIVTSDGKVERPVENSDASIIYNKYANL